MATMVPPRWLARGLRLWPGVLAFLCLTTHLDAVSFPLRWRWANPKPHGNNIVDMAYAPSLNLILQVSEQGQIFSSSDFTFWTPRVSGTTLALRSVAFFGTTSSPRILVTGENGTVLYADSVDQFLPGTLLDGPTSNWLEAVATSTALAVAVGDNGSIYTSNNGIQWKRQIPSPAIAEWLRGIAFGQGVFIIAGDNGYIGRSPNGTNWLRITSGTTTHLNRVSFFNSRFTVVGNDGFSLFSTNNGLSWVRDVSGATNDLFHAASGPNARLLIGDQEVRLHQGIAWANQLTNSFPPPVWTYYTALAQLNYFRIAGRTGLMAEGFNTNSTSFLWAPSDSSIRTWLFDLCYATNLYVAVGDRGTIMTSGSGSSWKLEAIPTTATNAVLLGVGGSTNLLLAAGNAGTLLFSPNIITNVTITNGTIITNLDVSTLGVVWNALPAPPTTNDLQGVCFGNNLYVVSGDNGLILTSPDGTNWTQRVTPTPKLLSSVTAWPGGFAATGDDGAIVTSPDGVNWTLRASGTTNWLYKVRYLNGLLLAVGQNGILLTSSDAVSWTARTSGTTAWLNDATFIQDAFFIVGTQGTVLTSSNATQWTSRGTLTKKALYAAATDGEKLITAGVEGVILRSPVVPNLTPPTILSFAHVIPTNSPAIIQNLYLFGGLTDQQFTLDRQDSLQTNQWISGPALEFFDPSGTLFYLESFALSNAPPEQFFRATLLSTP